MPGIPLAALGALLAGWLTGFEQIPVSAVVIVTAFAVLAQIIDYVAGVVGARRYGASQAGVWGSVIGSVVGIFFFPPFGFLIGAVVGAVGAELLTKRTFKEALRSGLGAFVGTLGGVFAKIFIVIAIGITVFPKFFS